MSPKQCPQYNNNNKKIKMNLTEWKNKFETGNVVLDDEHRQLFVQINECITASRSGQSSSDLISRLQAIYSSLLQHFEHEEHAMAGMAGLDFSCHKAQHNYLLDRIKSEIFDFTHEGAHGRTSIQEILFVLHDWYVAHITIEDRKVFAHPA